MKFYTDPGHFFEQWYQQITAKDTDVQTKKQKQRNRKPVSFNILYVSEGSFSQFRWSEISLKLYNSQKLFTQKILVMLIDLNTVYWFIDLLIGLCVLG